MRKQAEKRAIAELENAELQEDRTIKVDMKWPGSKGTINYIDFRCFCDELIRKIRTG